MPRLDPEQLRTFGSVGTLGFEMVLSVLVGYFGGQWLDAKFGTHPWLTGLGVVAGVGAALKSVHRVAVAVRNKLEPAPQNQQSPPDGE